MKKHSRLLILILLGIGMATFFSFGWHKFFTLDYLKSQQDDFQSYVDQNFWSAVAIYSLVYIVTTALSLPGAGLLTLLGGALFGIWTGTIIVSFASTIGATLAFWTARFLLRDWVQSKFSDRIRFINDGFRKDGDLYLFTLRLVPFIPFFVINLLMGLTSISSARYYVVSQIGMLPSTLVYVNAGLQLSQIESIKGIISSGLLFSFVLLGILPLLAKKIIANKHLTRARAHSSDQEKTELRSRDHTKSKNSNKDIKDVA